MLQALKSQLKALAADPHDPFTTKVRRRVGARNGVAYVGPLRNFVLIMPELIAQIRAWLDVPGMPPQLKHVHGFLLTYLYEPADFLPEAGAGLFGYLDDAYLVGTVYVRTLSQIDHRHRRALPNLDGFAEQLPRWLDLARQLLPVETKKIDELLDEIVAGRTTGFNKLMAKGH